MAERLPKVWWPAVKPPIAFQAPAKAPNRAMVWESGILDSMVQSFDWRGAMEMCREVLQDDPDHLGALETLVKAQWLAGQYQDVIHTAGRLLRLNPYEPGYRYTRGMAYMSIGLLRRSAEDFELAYAQSRDAAFRSQVASALQAVELWLGDELPATTPQVTLADRAGYGSLTSLRVH